MGIFSDLHEQDLADQAKQNQQQPVKKQSFLQTNKETSFQVNNKALKQVSEAPTTSVPPAGPTQFNIADEPYAPATFKFTDGELDALEDLKRDLKRQRDLKTTKQNLMRYAVHRLIEEYIKHGEDSWLVKRLRTRKQ